MGRPNIDTLTSPYGNGRSDQIEGLKFTIHGDVRWMSTILPQTNLNRDQENKKQNIESKVAPARQYKSQVETEFRHKRLERKEKRNERDNRGDQK